MYILDCYGIPSEITETINAVYKVLVVVVPILVVIFGLIDLIKAVVGQKDDQIRTQSAAFVKRVIICLLVFFVLAFVSFLLHLVKTSEAGDAISCLQEVFG